MVAVFVVALIVMVAVFVVALIALGRLSAKWAAEQPNFEASLGPIPKSGDQDKGIG